MQILYAFYDLKVSPCTYDIVNLIFLAEMRRLNDGLDAIDLVVVANDEADGYRVDASEMSKDSKDWMLRHVLLECYTAIESCRRSIYCPTREDAKEIREKAAHVFPEGYDVDAPVPSYLINETVHYRLRGFPYASVKARPEALSRIDAWLAPRAHDRRVVTVTLRETEQNARRNSNVPAWIEFAQSLDPNIYFPVILRDTAKIFEPPPREFAGLTNCDEASLNFEIRTALYERAYLNLIINNGPNGLLHLNPLTRYLQLRPLEDEVNTTEHYERKMGSSPEYRFLRMTPYQRILFDRDNLENIQARFEEMVELIDSDVPSTPEDEFASAEVWLDRFAKYGAFKDAERIHLFLLSDADDPASMESSFNVLVETRTKALLEAGYLSEARDGYRLLTERAPGHDEYVFELLKVLIRLNELEEFVSRLDYLESRDVDLSALQLLWGQVLVKLERFVEALPHFESHLRANLHDHAVVIEYADALGKSGDRTGQIGALERALMLIPADDAEGKADIERALAIIWR